MLRFRQYGTLAAFALLLAAQNPVVDQDKLAAYRNLGKAFYENPTTHKEAVAEFAKALALNPGNHADRLNHGLALLRAGSTKEGMAELELVQKFQPSLPHTWFNLAIQWKRFGETDRALAQIRQFVKLQPSDPPGQYCLGALLKQDGDIAGAIQAFQQAAALDSRLFGPHFQLFNLYRQTGKPEEAKKELEAFQRLKKLREGDPIPEDMEWSWFSEVFDEAPARPFVPKSAPVYQETVMAYQPDAKSARLLMIADGLLVTSTKGVAVLNRAGAVLFQAGPPYFAAAAGDAVNNGKTDLALLSTTEAVLFSPGTGGWVRSKPLAKGRFESALWLDYDHDNDLDLLLLGEAPKLLRNEGENGFNEQPFPFAKKKSLRAAALRVEPDSKATDVQIEYAGGETVLYRDRLLGKYEPQPAAKKPLFTEAEWTTVTDDLDGNGRLDQFGLNAVGQLVRRVNSSAENVNWMTFKLEGVKSLKLAIGAEIEVKAGRLYEKRYYTGAPMTFLLGAYKEADTVRITWPNGLIQNEVRQAANKAYVYQEAQRLSGSCPQIWTWNGKAFQYITDVLGVAPLGASSGDGQYFPVDHDEYIQIPKGALQARNGEYEIRITEELSEVAYLDQVQLLAVDHPAGPALYTNDKFKGPPFPEFKLFAATKKIYPKWHGETMDFGHSAPRNGLLVLTGWADWADGSAFAQAAQARRPLRFPTLQAQDHRGHWKTVVADMGLPSGKTKTIVVELKNLPSGKLRIVTDLAVHWTDIFLTPDAGPPRYQLRESKLNAAALRFRGFSRVSVDPARQRPEQFYYDQVTPVSNWNPTPGLYTRYGPVEELLGKADDQLTVMGSGDELSLRFGAGLPPVEPGYQRDFLLKVDGWAKDRDPNTAFSQTVEPLPFHGMTTYPYPARERHPGGEWTRKYNTRPALRLLRPLVSQR